mgnify:CR=1 FL=1
MKMNAKLIVDMNVEPFKVEVSNTSDMGSYSMARARVRILQ